ncbi:ABC transporter permease [Streptomyces sp. NPDC051940]|uniref:ABC transporter permease n=1 Tax=Streptomyces sp. NPDC051940 TaxID=3155675 RepID=UPI003419961B
MTTITAIGTTPRHRISASGVLRSEWTKLWSLRSTWYSLASVAVLTLGLGLVIGATYEDSPELDDPVLVTLFGLQFGQMMVAVLGVLATAGEWSTGMARASFAAVPRRLPVLWAKAAVLGAAVFAVGLVTAFVTFPVAQQLLAGTQLEAALGDDGVVRGLFGAAAMLSLTALLGLGLGALLRSTPAAIGTFVGVVMILPQVARLIPYDWVDTAMKYTPLNATDALISASPAHGSPTPLGALITLLAWAGAVLAGAAVRLVRSDV